MNTAHDVFPVNLFKLLTYLSCYSRYSIVLIPITRIPEFNVFYIDIIDVGAIFKSESWSANIFALWAIRTCKNSPNNIKRSSFDCIKLYKYKIIKAFFVTTWQSWLYMANPLNGLKESFVKDTKHSCAVKPV